MKGSGFRVSTYQFRFWVSTYQFRFRVSTYQFRFRVSTYQFNRSNEATPALHVERQHDMCPHAPVEVEGWKALESAVNLVGSRARFVRVEHHPA